MGRDGIGEGGGGQQHQAPSTSSLSPSSHHDRHQHFPPARFLSRSLSLSFLSFSFSSLSLSRFCISSADTLAAAAAFPNDSQGSTLLRSAARSPARSPSSSSSSCFFPSFASQLFSLSEFTRPWQILNSGVRHGEAGGFLDQDR